MTYCTSCGSEVGPGDDFCVSCGTPAPGSAHAQPETAPLPVGMPTLPPPSAPPTSPPPSYFPSPTVRPTLPPPPAAPPGTASGLPFDVTRLLTGNWLGSARVALVMLVTAGVLSSVLGLMAKPADFGIDNTLTGVMMILAATFGADPFLEGEFDDDVAISTYTSTYPLTVTIVTFAVGVIAFRRLVRGYPSVVPALGDAARVALFVAIPIFVGSLVLRSDIDELGGGWMSEAADDVSRGDSATWGVSAPSALLVTFGLVLLVLALACVARRDWWPGQWRPVAEWLAPAVQGVALMALLLPLCGLVGIGVLLFGPDNDVDLHETTSDETWAVVALLAGGLGNGGEALLGLGSGAELGAAGEFETSGGFPSDEGTEEEFHRLAWYAGDQGEEPGLWAAPAILLLVLASCAAWVASRSREVSHIARNLAIWCALLLVAVPWLIRLANLHGAGSYEYAGEDAEFSGFVGLAGGEATFYTFLIAVAVSAVVALVRGGLSATQLRALFGRLQANPGGAPPAPSYPPSAPPPPPSYPPPPSAGS